MLADPCQIHFRQPSRYRSTRRRQQRQQRSGLREPLVRSWRSTLSLAQLPRLHTNKVSFHSCSIPGMLPAGARRIERKVPRRFVKSKCSLLETQTHTLAHICIYIYACRSLEACLLLIAEARPIPADEMEVGLGIHGEPGLRVKATSSTTAKALTGFRDWGRATV